LQKLEDNAKYSKIPLMMNEIPDVRMKDLTKEEELLMSSSDEEEIDDDDPL